MGLPGAGGMASDERGGTGPPRVRRAALGGGRARAAGGGPRRRNGGDAAAERGRSRRATGKNCGVQVHHGLPDAAPGRAREDTAPGAAVCMPSALPSNPEPARCMYLVPLAYGVTISSPLFAMEGAAMGVGAARTPEACITLGANIETRCFQPSHMQRSVDL